VTCEHVLDKSDTLPLVSSLGTIKQDGDYVGAGLHRPAVQAVAGARGNDRAGAEDDLAVQEWNLDAGGRQAIA